LSQLGIEFLRSAPADGQFSALLPLAFPEHSLCRRYTSFGPAVATFRFRLLYRTRWSVTFPRVVASLRLDFSFGRPPDASSIPPLSCACHAYSSIVACARIFFAGFYPVGVVPVPIPSSGAFLFFVVGRGHLYPFVVRTPLSVPSSRFFPSLIKSPRGTLRGRLVSRALLQARQALEL